MFDVGVGGGGRKGKRAHSWTENNWIQLQFICSTYVYTNGDDKKSKWKKIRRIKLPKSNLLWMR